MCSSLPVCKLQKLSRAEQRHTGTVIHESLYQETSEIKKVRCWCQHKHPGVFRMLWIRPKN